VFCVAHPQIIARTKIPIPNILISLIMCPILS